MKENDKGKGRPDQFKIQTNARPESTGQTHEGGEVNTPLVFFLKQEVVDKLNPQQSAEERASQILQTMSQLQYIIAMRQYNQGQERELGEKLAPYKNSIQKLEMAYEIVAYPLLEETDDGLTIREAVRDARQYPNKDIQVYPHRAPFELNDEEAKLLGQLARTTDLPYDPKKRIYSHTELAALRDARSQAIMDSPMARMAIQNAMDAGILRQRSDIEKEIHQRRLRLLSPETKPSDAKK